MKIVVAGDGSMAKQIVEALMLRHQVVCLITGGASTWDADQLNADVVTGEMTSPQTLTKASSQNCDVFVACSSNDEQNIVACMAARRLGAKKTTCVLTRQGFLASEGAELAQSLGIDQIIRPIEQLAQELLAIVLVPGSLEIQHVADGGLSLFRFAVGGSSKLVGKDLASLSLPTGTRLVHVRRGDEFIVPRGSTRLKPGDKVIAMGFHEDLTRLGFLFSGAKRKQNEAVIIGGGRVGRSLTRGLLAAGFQVKVIEADRERCDLIAQHMSALVIHGDGTDLAFLDQERVGDAPVVVAVTSSDERNLLVSLVVKQLGTARVITRADRLSNEKLFERVGVDVVRSARGAALRTIIGSIDRHESEIEAELEHGEVCVVEVTVEDDANPTKLADLRPPAYAVIGAILRGGQRLVPGGQDEVRPGDHLFVFCGRKDEELIREYFEEPRLEPN